jgi:LmbE family N-acetylglucosaminyl deacetylase
MNRTYQHIYLSPHYDDAALSCGGTIHHQTRAGEPVLVMTICAAPPPMNDPFSPFAQGMHDIWGELENVIATRQTEDRAAMEILGADHVWFDFLDCIYRGDPQKSKWFYNNNDGLYGEVHPADWGLVDSIIETLEGQNSVDTSSIIYAPLTVGHHVDHQIVHAAAWELYNRGRQVMFYEDYPYADTEVAYGKSNLDETLARLKNQQQFLQSKLHPLSESDLDAKINSILAYASQLEMLFGDSTRAKTMIDQYARHIGEGEPAERFWIPAQR